MPKYSAFGSAGGPFAGVPQAPSFSENLAGQSLGLGSAASTPDEAPDYSSVGKVGVNLLDPNPPAKAPEDHGGFFAGLLGAVGGTLGEPGRAVGETVGKVLEAPLGLAGGILGGIGSVKVPFGTEIARGVGVAAEGLGLTHHGQKVNPLFRDVSEGFSGVDDVTGEQHDVNLGGYVQALFGSVLGAPAKAVARQYASGSIGASGGLLARREAIPPDLQERIDRGEIGVDEALDEMVASNRAFSDNPAANIFMSLVTDPLNVLSAGVGVAGKAVTGAEKITGALKIAGALGQDASRLSAGAALAARLPSGERAATVVSRLERASLMVAGRTPLFDQVMVPVANQVIRFTDPLKLWGGGNIGKRATEHIAMATSSGVIAAFKPSAVHWASGVLGEEQTSRLLGLRGTNVLSQVALEDTAVEAMRTGRVEFLTGADGVAVTPTAAARVIRGVKGAFDSNIGRTIEQMVERQKPSLAHLSDEGLRRETAAKVAAMGGDASKIGRKVNYDQAALVHAMYYDHMASNLADRVVPALKQVADLPKDIVPERLTAVGERTLTNARLPELETALKAGDAPGVRAFINRYDDFNWISEAGVDVARNDDLLDAIGRWVGTHKEGMLTEVPLIDAATGALRTDLPEELARWGADAGEFGYRVALAPPTDIDPELLMRLTKDADGRVINAKPWLDYVSEVMPTQLPGKLGRLRTQMLRPIRAERILTQNQRRFVRGVVQDGVSERDANAIYREIMRTATEAGVTARGLSPNQLYTAANRAIKRTTGGRLGAKMTEKQIVNHLLVAMRGDLSQVGLSQGLTGLVKARAPGSRANIIGRIAEDLYPKAKFVLSPWFLAQEYIEPYVLNVLRGVPLPLRKDSPRFQEALAFRDAYNQVLRKAGTELDATLDVAETQQLLVIAANEVHQTIGRRTGWVAKLGDSLWGDIAKRKEVAEAVMVKDIFGKNLKKAFDEMRGPDHWKQLEQAYGTVDKGEIGFRWMAENFTISNANGARIGEVADLLNDQLVGRSTRVLKQGQKGDGVTWSTIGQWLGRTGDDATIEAELMGSLKAGFKDATTGSATDGALSRTEFMDEMTKAGVEPFFAERAYHMATGPEVKDFWREYKNTFFKPVKGAKGKAGELAAHRALVQVRAMAMGVSEDEFIKTHFALPPEGLSNAQALDGLDALHEIRQTIDKDFLARHGDSLERARAAVASAGAGPAEAKPSFRSRAVAGLLSRDGPVNRTVMAERADNEAGHALFNQMAAHDPEALRSALELMAPADRRMAERAIDIAAEAVPAAPIRMANGEVWGRVSAADHLANSLAMDPVVGRAMADWYPDMRQRFLDIFGEVNGPVLLSFAVSQASNSPTRGIADVLATVENLFAHGFDSRALARSGKGEVLLMAQRRVITDEVGNLFERAGGLNEANQVAGLIGDRIHKGFAAKLNDFLDSLLGNQSRRWTGRSGGLQPAAIDRWTARDIGYMDDVSLTHMVDQGHARPVAGQDGLFELVDEAGTTHLTFKRGVGETGKSTWFLADREGAFVDRAGQPLVGKRVTPLGAKGHLPEGFHLEYDEGADARTFKQGGIQPGMRVRAVETATGAEAGRVFLFIDEHGLRIDVSDVQPAFKRKGIANAMYAAAEERTGKVIARTGQQSAEAKALWAQADRPFGNAGAVAEPTPVHARDFDGAPTDAQYEHGVAVMNEAKDLYNSHVDRATGIQGVFGKTDWTAADVQAVGWGRIQRTMGGTEDFSATAPFRGNERVIAAEVTGEQGSEWEKYQGMLEAMTPDARARLTADMNVFLGHEIQDMFGATTVVSDFTSMARWNGGARSLTAPTVALATPEMGDDIADFMAYTLRQREVWHPKPVATSSFDAAVHHPVLDIALPPMDEGKANALLSKLQDAFDAPGSTIFKNVEGRQVLRIIDRPFPGDEPFLARLTKNSGKLKAGMADPEAWEAHYAGVLEKAGLPADTFDEPTIWNADVYIAGPRLRATAEDVQRAYDAGDTALGQRLNSEVAVGRGGSVESGGAIKSTGAPASDLVWETALDDTISRLGRRGRPVAPDELRGVGGRATERLRELLTSDAKGRADSRAPANLRAVDRGDGAFLADARGGAILGYTRRVDGDTRRIIGGLKNADPVTGLHELMHVFATDLDPSMRDVVMRARRTAIDASRTDLEARIAVAKGKAEEARTLRPAGPDGTTTTMRSARTAKKYDNQVNALENELGAFNHEETWGVAHEEWFVEQFHHWVKTGEAPSGLNAAFEHFKNWINQVWGAVRGKGKDDGVSPEMAGLFSDMFSKPHVASVNFDLESYANRLAGKQALMAAQEEAFTTQYFKQGRSFAERSINHPYVGLYPFSYMWGKVLPEMFRFLALRPFGFEAPLLGWNVSREVNDTINSQKLLDPSFAKFLEDNKDSFGVINTMFPMLPNEAPFNAPLPLRRVAQQGLENADRAAAGEPLRPIDYSRGIDDAATYILGVSQTSKNIGALLGSVGDVGRNALGIKQDGQAEKEAKAAGTSTTPPPQILNPVTGGSLNAGG